MISDEEFLLLCDAYSSKNPEFEPQRVLKSVTAAQECLDTRSGCHAAKITSGWRPWYQERLVLKFPIILRWTAKHINIVTLPPLS